MIVYVDDIIITGDDVDAINNLKRLLQSEFKVKDLGKLQYFLGIEIARSKDGIFISQRKYILDLLQETGKLGCRPATTPMEKNWKEKLTEEDPPTNRERYQRIVGKLIYLSLTRPDIAYSVSQVSQFMHTPTIRHQNAVDQILRYLKGTPGKGMLYKKPTTERLRDLLMQIGQIANQQQGTVPSFGEMWSLGEAKSNQSCQEVVPKQSIVQLHMEFVS